MTNHAEPRPLPILLMARHLEQGGIERDLTKLATHIDRSRFTPHVATYFDYGMRLDELRRAEIPILYIPVTSVASSSAAHALIKLCLYIRRHGIRLLHAFDSTAFLGALAGRLMCLPAIVTSQLSYRSILDKRTALILRMSDRLTNVVHVNCKAIQAYMVEHEHIPADRVFLCYNGVDTSVFFPPTSPKPSDAPLVIGTVCALRREKNLPVLQEAFARVRHYSTDMKLRIIGSGAELVSLQANAARLGIAEVSEFFPALAEVATCLRSIDIFVLPSYSEGFSNSLLEAMACGCAVIGSRVGGTPELIGNNERGLLFTSGDATDLSLQLLTLIHDKAQRQTFGYRAANFVRHNLNLRIAVERQSELYERLLQTRSSVAQHSDCCPPTSVSTHA